MDDFLLSAAFLSWGRHEEEIAWKTWTQISWSDDQLDYPMHWPDLFEPFSFFSSWLHWPHPSQCLHSPLLSFSADQSLVDISMQGSESGIDMCHGNYIWVVWFRHCHFREGTLISVSFSFFSPRLLWHSLWSDSSVLSSYKVLMNQLIKKTGWQSGEKMTRIVIRTVKEMT